MLKATEGGWAHQTDGNRAYESVVLISVFLLVNAYILIPDAPKGTYSWIVIFSLGLNALILLPKKRFLRFLEEFQTLKHKTLLSGIAITYIVVTLLSMTFYWVF